MLSLGLRGLTVAVAAMAASPAQPRRRQVLFDVRSAGRNITHAAGGGLNTFCTDPAHGLGHQLEDVKAVLSCKIDAVAGKVDAGFAQCFFSAP